MDKRRVSFSEEYIEGARQDLEGLRSRFDQPTEWLSFAEESVLLPVLGDLISRDTYKWFETEAKNKLGLGGYRILITVLMGGYFQHPAIVTLLTPTELESFSRWSKAYGARLGMAYSYAKNPRKLSSITLETTPENPMKLQLVRADGVVLDLTADHHDLIGALEMFTDLLIEFSENHQPELDNYDTVSLKYIRSMLKNILEGKTVDDR